METKKITLSELAEMADMRLRDLKATLTHGWTPKLLALAGNVTASYFRGEIRKKRFPGSKFGFTWVIPREWGDKWLLEKKNTIIVEDK
jgi:hypothetical protein